MNNTTATVTLAHEEIRALLGLIDMAVKAGGLQVAEAAVVLATKLADAAKAAQKPAGPAVHPASA